MSLLFFLSTVHPQISKLLNFPIWGKISGHNEIFLWASEQESNYASLVYQVWCTDTQPKLYQKMIRYIWLQTFNPIGIKSGHETWHARTLHVWQQVFFLQQAERPKWSAHAPVICLQIRCTVASSLRSAGGWPSPISFRITYAAGICNWSGTLFSLAFSVFPSMMSAMKWGSDTKGRPSPTTSQILSADDKASAIPRRVRKPPVTARTEAPVRWGRMRSANSRKNLQGGRGGLNADFIPLVIIEVARLIKTTNTPFATLSAISLFGKG